MDKTYLFYDLETTGTNSAFDQALQFAAIRTDMQLNELERHEIQIKLNPDVIPHPEALLIHRIPIESMLQGQPEIEVMAQIHALLNKPGTQSGGYNTLKFDDEMLRFAFHRNLLPPYTHQWMNGCGRFDLYPIAQLYYLFHREALNWPVDAEGKVSLKLENLSKMNHLAKGPAHQAIVDVEATVALARLFAKSPEIWNYAMGFFDKKEVAKRIEKLNLFKIEGFSYSIALRIGKSSSIDFFQYPVMNLGIPLHYQNQQIWLRLDKAELSTATPETVAETTRINRQKPGEFFLLPYIERHKRYITPEREAIVEANLKFLQANPELFKHIQAYHLNYKYPEVADVDIDANLYLLAFPKDSVSKARAQFNEKLSARFHVVPDAEKAEVVDRFTDQGVVQRAVRALGRHGLHLLPSLLAQQFQSYLEALYSETSDMPVDWRGEKRLGPKTALQVLKELKAAEQRDIECLNLLNGLEDYLKGLVIERECIS